MFRAFNMGVGMVVITDSANVSAVTRSVRDAGINVNMEISHSIDRDGSILDYCRLNDITIQPWSPFQYGFFEGVFLDNEQFPELNQCIDNSSTYSDMFNFIKCTE
mgnify:CR=1 FL=1